jgi:hypothetical protein
LNRKNKPRLKKALDAIYLYQQQFAAAVAAMGQPGNAPRERIEAVVRNYERDLNGLVQKDSHTSRTKLVDELRTQVDSFDAQITSTVETGARSADMPAISKFMPRGVRNNIRIGSTKLAKGAR